MVNIMARFGMDNLPVNVLHGKAGAHQIETVEARVLPLKEVILP